MVNDVKANVDWDWVKTQYEAGKSLRAIARELKDQGVTINHQGLSEKARRQGWAPPQPPPLDPPPEQSGGGGLVLAAKKEVGLGKPLDTHRLGLRTEENLNYILKLIGEGASQNAAAKAAGIGSSTLSDWRREIPGFAERLDAARWHSLGGTQRAIWKAADRGDWRAAKEFLAHAPETKAEWGDHEGESGGIRIEFRFDRPPPMIDVTPKREPDKP